MAESKSNLTIFKTLLLGAIAQTIIVITAVVVNNQFGKRISDQNGFKKYIFTLLITFSAAFLAYFLIYILFGRLTFAQTKKNT